MNTRTILFLWFCASSVVTPICAQQLEDSHQFVSFFYEIWRESRFGRDPSHAEVAVWITRSPQGYRSWKWPASNSRDKQIWNYSKPYGAVAIVHTHSHSADPRPSTADVLLSKRINTTIYAVSRNGVWKVTPDGFIHREEGPEWHKGLRREGTHPAARDMQDAFKKNSAAIILARSNSL